MEKQNISHGEEFTRFLVEAKKAGYAGNGEYILNEKTGFKEFEFKKDGLIYRDSYVGNIFIQGHETVHIGKTPIWGMSYGGGIISTEEITKGNVPQIFAFLKKALGKVGNNSPFRGPATYIRGDLTHGKDDLYLYIDRNIGNMCHVKGTEKIFHNMELGKKRDKQVKLLGKVYELNYVGNLIIPEKLKNPLF